MWIGIECGKTKYLCCKTIKINQFMFHYGHIVSESDGGTNDIE